MSGAVLASHHEETADPPDVALARVGSATPTWADAAIIGAVTIASRVLVFALVSWRLRLSVNAYAHLYDGHSYLIMARAMLGETAEFTLIHTRMFPGFAALAAFTHLVSGLPLAPAALGLNWIGAGLVAMFSTKLFHDRRVGWATGFLISHFVMNSTMAMSEAPMLALTTGGLLLASRQSSFGRTAGGALVGLAGMVRPMACFAAAGGALRLMLAPGKSRRHRIAAGIVFALAAAAAFGAGALAYHAWRGDVLDNVKAQANVAYGGRILDWPFSSLIAGYMVYGIFSPRGIYMGAHIVVAVAACALAVRAMRSPRAADDTLERSLNDLAAPWLLGNTVFVLCVGGIWGFECFHRFLVPALPAMAWFLRRFLPSGLGAWLAIAALSSAIAVLTPGVG